MLNPKASAWVPKSMKTEAPQTQGSAVPQSQPQQQPQSQSNNQRTTFSNLTCPPPPQTQNQSTIPPPTAVPQNTPDQTQNKTSAITPQASMQPPSQPQSQPQKNNSNAKNAPKKNQKAQQLSEQQRLNQLKYQQKIKGNQPTAEPVKEESCPSEDIKVEDKPKPSPSPSPSTPQSESQTFDNGGSMDDSDTSVTVFDPTKTLSTKEHFNVVFVGHVDAGKSTLCGNILVLMGIVDDRTIEKYKQEAKTNNRESWFLAYVMDTNEEEKAKGKTVEVGRAYFETENRRFTLLDCPGHKNYVPNMISGASQADIGVLVISARKGEFEAGFDRSGQTSEHAILIRTLGVTHVIVVINKMDEETVLWEQSRFDILSSKLETFLTSLGFKTIQFIPISAKNGDNLKSRSTDERSAWYTGPTLIDYLNSISSLTRDVTGPFRFPILEAYNESAFWVGGKIESGFAAVGKKAVVMPGRKIVEIAEIQINDVTVEQAGVGENIMMKLKYGSEQNIKKGMILSYPSSLCPVTYKFKAHLRILEIPTIMSAGFPAVCHIHTTSEDCIISEILESTDMSTKKLVKNPSFTKKNSKILCIIELSRSVAMESSTTVPSLARISLRDQSTTVAIGFIVELLH